jgi:uncharacterized protein YkwD
MRRMSFNGITFNVIDALLALVVLLGAFGGWRRGFVVATLELVTLLASVLLAFLGYRYVAAFAEAQWPALGVWAAPVSFLASFVLLLLLIGALTRGLARAVPQRAHAHGFNRFLGLAPGIANGLVNATVIALLLLTVPLTDGLSKLAREGALAGRLGAPAQWLEAQLAPIFDPAVQRTLQAITVPPQSRASIPLRFQVANPRPRPDLEARMLQMVNAERAKRGLEPLRPDPQLVEVARGHSRDMFDRGYFSHVSPDGGTLAERMRKGEARYFVAGENLALAPTLDIAHQGLMDSPGHRANILRPQFGRLGVGVLDGGRYGLMVTQNFRN